MRSQGCPVVARSRSPLGSSEAYAVERTRCSAGCEAVRRPGPPTSAVVVAPLRLAAHELHRRPLTPDTDGRGLHQPGRRHSLEDVAGLHMALATDLGRQQPQVALVAEL